MPAFRENDAPSKQHANAIEALCRRFDAPKEYVLRLYTSVLADFVEGARIKDYLPILVSSRVRALLRASGEGTEPDPGSQGRADH